jgi:hypothetical protein
MDCRCAKESLVELNGVEAAEYSRHLIRVKQQTGSQAWLMRCPKTGQEWVEDFPLDAGAQEWVGTARLRKLPQFWNR